MLKLSALMNAFSGNGNRAGQQTCLVFMAAVQFQISCLGPKGPKLSKF